MKRPLMLLTAVTMLVCSPVFAHPPGADGHHDDRQHAPPSPLDPTKVRLWTNARTGEAVRGAFLAARRVEGLNGVLQISIERESGDGGGVLLFAFDDLSAADKAEAQKRIDEIKAINEKLAAGSGADVQKAPKPSSPPPPPQAAPFKAFAPFVATRWDERWLYVESDGLPHVPGGKLGTYVHSHPMMVGITAWQQQVPMPQSYRGSNAWQVPLKPELADKPISAKDNFFRGAIALAANGVPIFNPIKNDGRTDTFLAGELDEFGGHCGRADDYHYHIAPTHLQKFVGKDAPIAYALDGFPIYGLFDPAARPGGPDADKCCPLGGTEKLDELNGHYGAPAKDAAPGTNGPYHYHASVRYPYLNGGMRGKVTVKDGQVDPQPRATSPRPALPPLRGARITGFKATKDDATPAWSLEYTIAGKRSFVNYRLIDGKWTFDFVDPAGATKTETYDAARPDRGPSGAGGGGGGEGRRRGEGGNRRGEGGGDRPTPPGPPRAPDPAPKAAAGGLALNSADVTAGRLSVECTCDGKGRAPSLAWPEPPTGTKAFAIVMHHITKDSDTHVYMVVANIPAATRDLKSGDTTVGTWGQNTVNRSNAYAPPCSQGPGDKTYTITLYALSAEAKLAAASTPLTRDALLAAIKDTTLASATMDVKYARVK